MATLSIVIRRAKPNKDGSYNIKISISSQGDTIYMPTRYNVDNADQFDKGKVRKRIDAKEMNRKLRLLLMEYEDIVDDMQNSNVPAIEIRHHIERVLNNPDTLKGFAENYIKQLEENGQTSYAQNMGYTLKYFIERFGEYFSLSAMSLTVIKEWEYYLFSRGDSATTVNIRMTHLKALLNAAVNEGLVEYKIFPFRNYNMPAKNVRDICITKSELVKLRGATFSGVSAKRLTVARDLFMLSFYCAGINLTDLMSAKLDGDILTFVRKKTAEKKAGADKEVSMTFQPEAREIINKYINERGELDMGYHYRDYEQFRSFVTKSLNRIGEELGFEKRLTFYAARKTFVQFGADLGIPIYVLEYAIGQTIKEANMRPVFDYIRKMRYQADLAIRTIIDYSFEPDNVDDMPLPEWARRR